MIQEEKTYFQLLREMKQWKPENKNFTTKEEIDMIINHFQMEKMRTIDLRNLRDMTVAYYTGVMANDNTNDYALLAMMSITAVIDRYILRKNPNAEV